MASVLSNIELLGSAGCPYALRSVALLVQNKIPFKFTQVDLQNKPQWLTSKSPLGKVPALVFEDHRFLFESQVINEFIDELVPADQKLAPSDPFTRASNKAWIEFGPSLLLDYFGVAGKTTKEETDAAITTLKNKIAVFEANAPIKGPYFNGDKIALVDIAWGGFATSLFFFDFVLKQDVGDKASFPKFHNYLKAVASIRSVEVAALVQAIELSGVDTTKPETFANVDTSDSYQKLYARLSPNVEKRFANSYLFKQQHQSN